MTKFASRPREWTVRRILDWTTDYLRRGGVDVARFEAETLLAHALGTDRLMLYLHPDRVVDAAERGRFRRLIKRRRGGTPLAYLLGTVEFMDATLQVNESVLIPRPETEELVEWVIEDSRPLLEGVRGIRALDLGTGSGALAVALAQAWPDAWVLALDISERALRLARENARRNRVHDRVRFVCSDWSTALRGRFDLLVANPPYIASEAFKGLSPEVRDYEPSAALVGGPRGTREIERIVRDAPRLLQPGGRLYLEIGADQADEVHALIENTGAFLDIVVRRDRGGRDRMIRALRGATETTKGEGRRPHVDHGADLGA